MKHTHKSLVLLFTSLCIVCVCIRFKIIISSFFHSKFSFPFTTLQCLYSLFILLQSHLLYFLTWGEWQNLFVIIIKFLTLAQRWAKFEGYSRSKLRSKHPLAFVPHHPCYLLFCTSGGSSLERRATYAKWTSRFGFQCSFHLMLFVLFCLI